MSSSPSERKLSIALASDFFYPSCGGVESHMYALALSLLKHGHYVVVITRSQEETIKKKIIRHDKVTGKKIVQFVTVKNKMNGVRYLTNGLKVYYLPYFALKTSAGSSTLPYFVGTLPILREIFIREKIDIVHGHQCTSSLATDAVLHAKTMGLRTVFTDHSLFGFDSAADIHVNKVLKFMISDIDHFICVSHCGKENIVLRTYINPFKVSVIPHGVDLNIFRPAGSPGQNSSGNATQSIFNHKNNPKKIENSSTAARKDSINSKKQKGKEKQKNQEDIAAEEEEIEEDSSIVIKNEKPKKKKKSKHHKRQNSKEKAKEEDDADEDEEADTKEEEKRPTTPEKQIQNFQNLIPRTSPSSGATDFTIQIPKNLTLNIKNSPSSASEHNKLKDANHNIKVEISNQASAQQAAKLLGNAVNEKLNSSSKPKTITIITVTRLVFRKGADLLFGVIPIICKKYKNVKFIVVGGGPKLPELKQVQEQHNLFDQLDILGALPHKNVKEVLVKGDIFLNCSLTEAFCIAIIEAASCGNFVVATRVGGVPEVLPEDMMLLADVTVPSIVASLEEAINVHVPKVDKWKNHFRVKAMYHWDDVSLRTEKVFQKIMDEEPKTFFERLQLNYMIGQIHGKLACLFIVFFYLYFLIVEWLTPSESIEKAIRLKAFEPPKEGAEDDPDLIDFENQSQMEQSQGTLDYIDSEIHPEMKMDATEMSEIYEPIK